MITDSNAHTSHTLSVRERERYHDCQTALKKTCKMHVRENLGFQGSKKSLDLWEEERLLTWSHEGARIPGAGWNCYLQCEIQQEIETILVLERDDGTTLQAKLA